MSESPEIANNQAFLRFVREHDIPRDQWEQCYWIYTNGFADGALWQNEWLRPQISQLREKYDDLAERAKEFVA